MTNRAQRQTIAEAEVEGFREELGPFVVAAETTRIAMVFTQAQAPDHPIIFANDSFLSLTGYDRAEVLGQSFNFLMAKGADAVALAAIKSAFEDSGEGEAEIRYRRKDGTVFWASLFVSPVRNEHGKTFQYFASLIDLTSQKHEQVQANMLINELNHRVKNTLSTVQSIVSQALRGAFDLAGVREAIESRLFALSRSHDLLTHRNWEGAGLLDLINAAMEPFGVADGRAERFVITGENVLCSPNASLALGIAFHELATNAVKYGSLSNEAGSVLIAWTIEPGPEGSRVVLHWQERDGPPVSAPTRKGFGSRVIERGLAHELAGQVRLDYRIDGVVCTMDFPAPRGASDE